WGAAPVAAPPDVDRQRRVEFEGTAHLALDQLRGGIHLVRRALEEELVVNLQDEACLKIRIRECLLAADHRDLDDVRRGSLDRHVDREALALAADLGATGAELGNRTAPAEQRTDVAVRPGELDRLLDVALD